MWSDYDLRCSMFDTASTDVCKRVKEEERRRLVGSPALLDDVAELFELALRAEECAELNR